MLLIITANLALIVMALIASVKFSHLAESKGYGTSKPRKFVIFIAFVGLFLMMMGQTLISFVANLMNATNSVVADGIVYGWSFFVLLVCMAILSKAYQNMKQAPDLVNEKREK